MPLLIGESCVAGRDKQEKSVFPLINFKLTDLWRFLCRKIEIFAKLKRVIKSFEKPRENVIFG